MTYEQAYEDHAYLWSIDAAYDMTGGYVDSEDLDRLLASPNKRTALYCLRRQIDYWFQVGIEDGRRSEEIAATDPRVMEIGKRHGCL